MLATVKLSPQEYQLVSYAAWRGRARSVQTWMRERLLEAARARIPEKTAEEILDGRATAALLRESLAEAQARRRSGARVLAFRSSNTKPGGRSR